MAAYVGIDDWEAGCRKTKLDLLITFSNVTILSGGAVGILVGPGVSSFMTWLGNLVNWGTEQQPILMGIVVSVIMGMVLTLPISSAALGIILIIGVQRVRGNDRMLSDDWICSDKF